MKTFCLHRFTGESIQTRRLRWRETGTVEEFNAAVKIRVRVEHRLGEVLAETVSTNRYNTALHLPE
jgi:hypothetical protein